MEAREGRLLIEFRLQRRRRGMDAPTRLSIFTLVRALRLELLEWTGNFSLSESASA